MTRGQIWQTKRILSLSLVGAGTAERLRVRGSDDVDSRGRFAK
jgi:hypothetical protein